MRSIFFVFTVSILFAGFGCGPKGPSKPISEGERMFRNRCANCHRLPDQNRQDWPQVLKKHVKRANLNEAQIKMLQEFLSENGDIESK